MFPLLLASPIVRFLARIMDIVILLILLWAITLVAKIIRILGMDIYMAVIAIVWFLLSFGYPILLEWFWRGQTVGKKIMRIRVMDEQGLRLQFSQIVIRNLLRFIDALPAFYLVGGTACVLNAKGQRLGDIAANTIVVYHPKIMEPNLDQILPGKYNSFREYPHLAARLHQHISPQEAGIALQALTRRDLLEDDTRLELFEKIKTHMSNAVKFPPESTDGISDEQYVRNVVDILFKTTPH